MIGTYSQNEKAIGGNGTNTTFVSQKVPRGQTIEITYASVIDYTTKNKKLELGIRSVDSVDVYLKSVQESSTFGISIDTPIMLYEGESLIGVVEATTTSDALHFSVHGKRFSKVV